jgi:hypothetical protein
MMFGAPGESIPDRLLEIRPGTRVFQPKIFS